MKIGERVDRSIERLQISEENFKALAENAFDGILIARSVEGDTVYANKRAAEITGYSVAELLKTSIKDLAHPDEFKKIMERYRKRLMGKPVPSRYETVIIRKDGKSMPIELAATKTIWQKKPADIIFFRDITERKKVEDQSKRQAELMEKTFNSMTDAVFILDAKVPPTMLECNDAASAIFGYEEGEMLGKTANLLHVSAKAKKEFQSLLDSAVEEGRLPFHLPEFKMKRKDGSVFPSEHMVEQLLNDEGKRIGWVSIVRDITQRRKAEEELRHSEGKFRRLFMGNPEAAVYLDSDNRILDVNQRFEELFGYLSDEIKGKRINDVVVPRDKMEEARMLDKKAKKGYFSYETVRKRKDGALVPVSMSSAPIIVEKQVIGGVVLYKDITERIEAEEKLRKNEEKLRGIFFTMTDGITLVGLDGTILDCNDAVLRLHNVSRDEYVGKNVYDFIAPEDRQRAIREAPVVLEKKTLRSEVKAFRKEGEFFDAEINVSLLRDASGKPNAFLGVTRDITERKRMEENMKAKDRILAASISRSRELEMKNRFISAITHELRTPLISIKGYVDYLLTGKLGLLSEKIGSSLEVVKQNTDRLLNLTENLLDTRRLESGRLELDLKPIKFREIIDHCAREIQPCLKEKMQSLHLEVSEEPLMIKGDSVRLSQVVANLLNNACKFTPEKGDVILRVVEEENIIRVQVSDTGIGIKKEDLERVFQPFASIRKPEYFKGTGIGLSVTKGLVEAHGGKIWAESPGEGRGTTFTLILPKRKEKEVS